MPFLDELKHYESMGGTATSEDDDPFLDEISKYEQRVPPATAPLERPKRKVPPAPTELTPEERAGIIGTVEPPGFIATTVGRTTVGLIARAVNRALTDEPYVEPPEKDFGWAGNAASQVGSLFADPLTYVGVGSGAKLATATLGRRAAEEAAKRAIARRSIESAATFGTLTAAHDPLQQAIQKGTVDIGQTAAETGKSVLLGAAMGPAGQAGKLAIPAEIVTLGAGQAALQGRAPTTDDFLDAAGLILGVKGVGLVAKLANRLKARGPGENPLDVAAEVVGREKAEEILAAAVQAKEAKAPPATPLETPTPPPEQGTATELLTPPTGKPRIVEETALPANLPPEEAVRAVEGPGEPPIAPEVSAVQRIAEQTDVPPGAMGAVPEPFRLKIGGKEVEAPAYWPNEEVARRAEQARSVPPGPTIIKKVKDFLGSTWAKISRPHEELPEKPEFVQVRTGFDNLSRVGDLAREDATRTVAAVVAPFPEESRLKLFTDKLTVENELRNLDAGREPRFGFKDHAEIEATRDAIDAEVAKDPVVQTALENRAAVLNKLVPRLVKAKILEPEALKNPESYFHQEVLAYANLNERMLTGVGKLRLAKAGFQKGRAKEGVAAEEYDYLRNYIEAETRWMADAYARLRTSEIRERDFEPSNIYPQLQETAKEQGVEWHDLVPDTHDVYVPRYGSPLYRAMSIPERFADKIKDEVLSNTLKLSELKGHVKKVLALGRQNDIMVLPKPVVRQLELIERNMKRQDGAVTGAWNDAMKLWKLWTTQGPKRVIPYNVRNALGDLDVAITRGPRALRMAASHARELRDYTAGKLGVSPELRGALDHGVINAGFAARELVDLRDLAWFRRFFQGGGKLRSVPAKTVSEYFRVASKWTAFRENILRYGVYLDFLKDVRDGTLTNFGATQKRIAKELIAKVSHEAAAARLTNDLMIDYANRPTMTKWLRSKAMPFAAFMEANAKRYPRIFVNLLQAGEYKKASAYAGFTITKASASALLSMFRLSRLAWLTGSLYAWNYLMHPEEEKQLDSYTRQAPHAILGRNPDGTIIVMRDLGAIGDFMENLGLPTGLSMFDLYHGGQAGASDIAKESGKAAVNKLIQQIRPELKGMFEIPSGQTTFPDAFNPREQDRGETLANYFGLRDEYLASKGALLKEGSRARPHLIQRVLAGITDPRQNAISDMIELRSRFLESKGQESHRAGISKTRNMRQAAMAGDYEAFKEAFDVYLKAGGTARSFSESLQHMNPIRDIPLKHRQEFLEEFLSADQKSRLDTALQYATEMQSTMAEFWERAASG